MAFNSIQTHVSDGTLESVQFSIAFLSTEHLHFYVDDVEITTGTASQGVMVDGVDEYGVTLTAAVPSGAVFKVQRQTPRDNVPHVFSTGAALFTALTVDANNEYLLYVVQETYEQSGQGPFPEITELVGTEYVTVETGGARKQITVQNFLASVASTAALILDLANTTDPAKGAGMVGWFRSITGFVGRWIADKLSDVVHVKDFGCVGGDVDETAKLQAALNASAGQTLLFAPNTIYRSTEALVVPTGTTLDLNGSTLRFACIGSKSNLVAGSNCVIQNGTIENVVGTSGLEGTYQTPIILGKYTELAGVHNVELRRLKVKTVTPQGNGIAIFGDSANITIEDIEFPDSAYIGIPILAHWSFDGSSGSPYTGQTTHPNNIKIRNIRCGELTYNAGTGWFGTSVIFLSAVYNVEVDNVTVKNIPYGKIVTTYAGDWGFQFATATEQALGLAGIKVSRLYGKAMIIGQTYHWNPLEAVQKVWPGSVEYSDIHVVTAGGAENKAFRIEGASNVTISKAFPIGFYAGAYFGGAVSGVAVKGGDFANCEASAVDFGQVTSATRISFTGVTFTNSNTGELSATPDILLTNTSKVTLEKCEFNSPLATWNVRADNTNTKLRVIGNHTIGVLDAGSCYSFGSQSDPAICTQYQGNTSDVAPAGGIRSGQLMIPVVLSSRHGSSTEQRIIYNEISPDRGTCNVGDICYNSAPAVGQPKGWICTVAGTPGTWVSMGNL